MADRVRVVSSGASGPGRSLPLAAIAVALILVVAAFAVGRATAPSHSSTRTLTTTVSTPSQPAPSKVVDGVAVGYPHTQAGAVAALLADGQTLSDPTVLLNPTRRSQVLSLIATSQYAQTFSGAGGQALIQAEKNTQLGQGIESGAQTVFLSVPISYRVVSYSPQQIKLVGYGVSIVANDQGLSPRTTWATSTTTAVWQSGDWKVSSASSSAGPTPALTAQASTASAFLAALNGTKEVHDAP
jgi:hypothetical protein